MKSISIIIPNYNGEALLKENLPKVIAAAEYYKKNSKSDFEIILVDDYSKDASVEAVKKNFSNIKIVENEKNLGFASTVNIGVAYAKGEIVVLLNTDVAPEKGFLQPLLDHFKNEQVFAVGCMDKSIENGKVILRGRGIGKWERGFLMHARGEVNRTTTLWVNGGSGAFRKGIWDKLGGFDTLYSPFYWEDIDLSYRALKSGYKLVFEPRSIVVHEHEKGAIQKKYSAAQIKTIAYRNQFLFVWKNATDVTLQISHCMWLSYHIIKSIFSGDTPFLIGFISALIKFPQNQLISLWARRLFVKKDHDVIKEVSE